MFCNIWRLYCWTPRVLWLATCNKIRTLVVKFNKGILSQINFLSFRVKPILGILYNNPIDQRCLLNFEGIQEKQLIRFFGRAAAVGWMTWLTLLFMPMFYEKTDKTWKYSVCHFHMIQGWPVRWLLGAQSINTERACLILNQLTTFTNDWH